MTHVVRTGLLVFLGAVTGAASAPPVATAAFAPTASVAPPPLTVKPTPPRAPLPAPVGPPAGRAPDKGAAAMTVPPKPSPFVPLSTQTTPPGAARVAEAREHFSRGVQAFKDGALEAALAEFRRADDLVPSYRLHFNIAQVQYELRNYADAKRSFQRYLAEADSEVPADRRAVVEAELAKLDRLVAQFSVKTSVPGVEITVDGIPAGLVSRDNLVLVSTNPGLRRVSAAKTGFLPASLVVNVAPGERRRLVFELAPIAAARAPLVPPVTAGVASADVTAVAAGPQPRTKLWASVAAAATLATATGVVALLTRNAHSDFDRQLARVPNDRATVDDARRSMTRDALVADLLAGATAVATGLSIYFILTDSPETGRTLATTGASPPASTSAGVGLRGGF